MVPIKSGGPVSDGIDSLYVAFPRWHFRPPTRTHCWWNWADMLASSSPKPTQGALAHRSRPLQGKGTNAQAVEVSCGYQELWDNCWASKWVTGAPSFSVQNTHTSAFLKNVASGVLNAVVTWLGWGKNESGCWKLLQRLQRACTALRSSLFSDS